MYTLSSNSLFDVVPDGIVVVDSEGRITGANQPALALFGYVASEIVGQPVEALLPARFHAKHVESRKSYHHSRQERRMGTGFSLVGRRGDGMEIPVDISLSKSVDENGLPVTLAFVRDVSAAKGLWDELEFAKKALEAELDRRRRQRALTQLLQTLRSFSDLSAALSLHLANFFPHVDGGVFLLDRTSGKMNCVVSWGLSSTGREPLDVESCRSLRRGKTLGSTSTPCRHFGPTGGDSFCVPLVAEGEEIGLFTISPEATGNPFLPSFVEDSVPLSEDDRRLAVEIAERMAMPIFNLRLRDELREESIIDKLTGLYNRRYLEEVAEREIRRAMRAGTTTSFVILDLDHFKQVNDSHGHEVGDLLLRQLGGFLKARVRSSDTVCRYGGEEFVLILPETVPDNAVHLVEKLRRAWKEVPFHVEGGCALVSTFSAGVAACPRDGSTSQSVLRAADAALYRAKAAGRDRVLCAKPEILTPPKHEDAGVR